MASSTEMPAWSSRSASSRISACGDAVLAGAQRRLRRVFVLAFVVVVRGGEVAHRGLGLDPHVLVVVLDVEHGLRGVAHAPDDGGGDLDRVAALVVDLQPLAHQVVRAQADLLLLVERVGPAQAFRAVGADVLAEQQQDRRLVRLQHVEAGQRERAEHDQHDAEREEGQAHRADDEEDAGRDQRDADGDPEVAARAGALGLLRAGGLLHHGLLIKVISL